MVSFSSLEFLFRFLPVFFILYFITPSRHREITLLIGSIIFYAVGEPEFILVLVLATLINHLFAAQSWKVSEGFALHEWQNRRRKRYMIKAVALDVLVLCTFKMLGIFVSNALLPLGLSFYLFKMISFQVDLYRREV